MHQETHFESLCRHLDNNPDSPCPLLKGTDFSSGIPLLGATATATRESPVRSPVQQAPLLPCEILSRRVRWNFHRVRNNLLGK
jgi:hypothetical protein